ncbi:hypothetical protein GOFOIKOB_4520 [Methylobacterium tardum]|uniref:Bro-N domain-containing protein n=1 Tax=Methylobacterium tardum TaxID=374432 RepID=A0AA37TK92_9HYPH|nr:phage antirepressor KilAC domain-containing protein [Methylobacterium tardum]GJE51461.1 hypothetical protein GOFOIKOB_4520 [Methylobacterium tardum]GLS73642.1 hypothetical protein GCM10007890_56570 [Methylobacterium tardum]
MNAITKLPDVTVTTFMFGDQEIRVVGDGDDARFVAVDACAALSLKDVSDAVAKLDDDEKGRALIPTRGGPQDLLVVTESGLYTLILRCRGATTPGTTPHTFRRYVTGEVLPSIRKTGSYTLPAAQPQPVGLLEALRDPEQVIALIAHHAQATLTARAALTAEKDAHADTFQQLEDQTVLTRRASERAGQTGRELVVAQEVLAEQAPLVEAARRFRSTGKTENLRTLARILDAPHTEFFQWMLDRKFLFRESGWLQPRADLRKGGKDAVLTVRLVPCSDGQERWQTLVTAGGQAWFEIRWKAHLRIKEKEAAKAAAAAVGQPAPVEPTLFDDED